MTSRLRSALLTGAVAATLALGAAPAQADNQQDPLGLPAAEQTAPAPAADLVATDLEAAPATATAPSTEPAPATEIVPSEPAPAPVPADELLADALIPVLVEETETNDDGGTPTGAVEESSEDVDGGAGEAAPLDDGAVDASDSGSGEEQAPVSDPADPESETAPGGGSELAPVVEPGTPAAPKPSAPQAPVPAGFESIVVGDRTLTHADFNIPDDIAASDEETVARWMEENIDRVLESEGMIYLVDLMIDYLETGDREGLEALIRELGASDPAAAEVIIRDLDGWFLWFEEWPMDEPFPAAPAGEPAPAVSPASVEVAPAALVPAQKPAESAAAPAAAPAGQLAETGASGTIWLATGGAGLLLLGVAMVALRRRMA
ncbi:LPXTG cell wall anchor domain-containing protein [Arthrobacter sp. VKM Ac-2550]|uniref:LPXTG cell wall anchor domain-containing protein n=1 Tax=Crystallibacter permensis TaxID=1938888 RepID=UPI002225FF48|nr:LPXTG cell wall anchor domain-containing protein [Arthrobacter sp. VKM Ac-2550]MCW2130984.1 LPXTG-motif cell wall anchor domain-containing protein [Arthrobacter sp. VKM Ac-2550]